MPSTNGDLARSGYEAIARGDLDAVRAFLDPDVRWHAGDPTASDACQNAGQALEYIRRAAQRGAVGELVDVVDAGEKVVVILRPPGGSRLTANLTTFRDGLAVEMVHYPDPEDALAAVGRAGEARLGR